MLAQRVKHLGHVTPQLTCRPEKEMVAGEGDKLIHEGVIEVTVNTATIAQSVASVHSASGYCQLAAGVRDKIGAAIVAKLHARGLPEV